MHRRFAPIPLAAALCAAGAAHAQTSPYFIGVMQQFSHESGVVAAGSDTSSVTSLRAGVDQPIGRGRVFGEGSLSYTRYNKNENLNSRGHAARGTWEWETIGNLSGALTGSSTQRLSRLVGSELPIPPDTRNIERVNDADLRVRLGTAGPLALNARVGARTLSYSAPESDPREYDQHRAQLGVSYRVSGALLVGAGVSGQNYTYPRFREEQPEVYLPDHVRRRDAYITANWVPTGKSSIDARVAAGNIKYDVEPEIRNSSGITGFVTWNWRPTGKLSFATTFSRETGEETAFSSGPLPITPLPGAPVDPGVPAPPVTPTTPVTPTVPVGANFAPFTSTSSIVNQIAATGLYEVTAKIGVNASVVRARHAFSSNDRTDVTSLALGVRWAPTRALTFGCELSHESRKTTDASGASSDNEDAKSFGCFGQFLLHL